jgi:hypothetical protein
LANLVLNQRHLGEIVFSLATFFIVYLLPLRVICSQNKNCTDYGFQKYAFGSFIMAGAVAVAAWLLLNFYIRKIFWQHDSQIAQRDLGVNLDELLPDGFIYIETSSGPSS